MNMKILAFTFVAMTGCKSTSSNSNSEVAGIGKKSDTPDNLYSEKITCKSDDNSVKFGNDPSDANKYLMSVQGVGNVSMICTKVGGKFATSVGGGQKAKVANCTGTFESTSYKLEIQFQNGFAPIFTAFVTDGKDSDNLNCLAKSAF